MVSFLLNPMIRKPIQFCNLVYPKPLEDSSIHPHNWVIHLPIQIRARFYNQTQINLELYMED